MFCLIELAQCTFDIRQILSFTGPSHSKWLVEKLRHATTVIRLLRTSLFSYGILSVSEGSEQNGGKITLFRLHFGRRIHARGVFGREGGCREKKLGESTVPFDIESLFSAGSTYTFFGDRLA